MGFLDHFRVSLASTKVQPRATDASRSEIAQRLVDEGNALQDAGDLAGACRKYDEAVAFAPDFMRAHLNQGNGRLASDDATGALAAYQRAIELAPESASTHYSAGNALARLRRFTAAEAEYVKALAIDPRFGNAAIALGNVLDDAGRLADASSAYRRAVAIDDRRPEAHFSLANSLRKLGCLAEAAASYRRAIELRPAYGAAWLRLGRVLDATFDTREAEACYLRANELGPESVVDHSSLLFLLLHSERADPAEILAEHRRFAERFEVPLRGSWPKHANSRDPDRALRLGFVSADFREHAVATFIAPIFEQLARRKPRISVHAYYNHDVEEPVSRRLRGWTDSWHDVAALSDAALARTIERDEIDILFDLSGHTAGNRLLTFARKPAPVQVSWIGYPATTGLAAMDYYITDAHFMPLEQFGDQFTEKLVFLPAIAPYLPERCAPDVNPLPSLERGRFTFASFNRSDKISPATVQVWARVLREVPEASMLLGALPAESECERLLQGFSEHGIARERLDLRMRCALPDYLALHHHVDLCLDTFPYSGGTTTNHALWMGVPTLTLAGRTPPGRQGAAIMGHLGLADFVARDADDYVRKAVRWADDSKALAEIRAGLRSRFAASPVLRPDLVAAGLEEALRMMWRRWCSGLPPEAIDASRPQPFAS